MTSRIRETARARNACLSMEEIYLYLTQVPEEEARVSMESHLAECPHCRGELAGTLELLNDEGEESTEGLQEPSAAEIEDTLRLIRKTLRPDKNRLKNRFLLVAAAAVLIVIGIGIWGLVSLRDRLRSDIFYARARSELERVYEGRSPSDLRLDLPFHAGAVNRDLQKDEVFHKAETLFHQALALRAAMTEARLGLASIYLSQRQFELAQSEFQKALDSGEDNVQALTGRGVARFELANKATDPIQRKLLFGAALKDFDDVLRQNEVSPEALYNRVWVFFETGRHKEALQAINDYLSKDSSSIWAEKLRSLKGRINLTGSKNVEKEVGHAAATRNSGALSKLVALAPYQAASAIRYALRRSLEAEGLPMSRGSAESANLVWASGIMASACGNVTGDHSWHKLIRFYGGLSPPQRQLKRSLDGEFQKLVEHYDNREFTAVLRGSQTLEHRYQALQDDWQLLNVYHLCGNSYYYGRADFRNALASYRRMLSAANRTGAPDLIARSLGSLATVCLGQRQFARAQEYCVKLRAIADSYHLSSWQAYASLLSGDLNRYLNRLDDSLREYGDALKQSYVLNYELVLMNSLQNLGSVLEQKGRLKDAQGIYAEAERIQESFLVNPSALHKPVLVARKSNLLYKQADLLLRLDELDKARSFFARALVCSAGAMPELEARTRLGLAEISILRKNPAGADEELRKVQAIVSSGQYPEIDWRAGYLRGQLLQQVGANSEALRSYHNAVRIIEKMRSSVASESQRQLFFDSRFDPYRAIVSLLYHSLNDQWGAREYAARSKAITLRERLKASRLPEPDNGDFLSRGQAITRPARRIATLDYFLTNDEVFVFFEGQTRRKAASEKIMRAGLESQVAGLLESISARDSAVFHALSRELYKELIEPVQNALESDGSDVILVFPDGPLYTLPFAALENSSGIYLLEKHAIAYAPSRDVYNQCLAQNKEPGSPARTILLLDGSANLSGASDELARLSRLYKGGARMLSPGELSDCGRIAAQYDIFHFAGHAANEGGSASLTFQSVPGNRLECHTIAAWRLARTRLVNLAGCGTGIGPQTAGECPWGLVPAFLGAGAPAIIASLMDVEDAATEQLNATFYDLLIQGSVPKVKALQKAQLALLRSARAKGASDPASWAPYVLIGDPR